MSNGAESKSASDPDRLEEIPGLEAEIAQFTLELERTVQHIRELRAAEDPANGVFHHKEIFEQQQEKLRLEVEIKYRNNKINRIRLGIAEAGCGSETQQKGFLF